MRFGRLSNGWRGGRDLSGLRSQPRGRPVCPLREVEPKLGRAGVLGLFEWFSMGCPMLPTLVGSFAVCSNPSNLGPDQHLAGGFTTLQGPMSLGRLPEWILSTDPHLEFPSSDPLKERVCPAQQLFPRP